MQADPYKADSVEQAEADGQSVVNGGHGSVVKLTHPLAQTGLVDRAYLLQKNYTVAVQSHTLGVKLYVRRQPCLAYLAGYGCGDHSGTVLVAGVVLDDKHRAHAALLAAHYRAEVGVIDISSSDHD